ncbi:hypothetical protein CEXT_600931 [Caerostris extrusa]|uniref:Maturase K n=1 Tax=Caerostris extrusa TaxID=172846 RepID=A0AAV4XQN3_CAEEX|nr:hypothetical protein CEXT_600931 [Caerostris extrusa]
MRNSFVKESKIIQNSHSFADMQSQSIDNDCHVTEFLSLILQQQISRRTKRSNRRGTSLQNRISRIFEHFIPLQESETFLALSGTFLKPRLSKIINITEECEPRITE